MYTASIQQKAQISVILLYRARCRSPFSCVRARAWVPIKNCCLLLKFFNSIASISSERRLQLRRSEAFDVDDKPELPWKCGMCDHGICWYESARHISSFFPRCLFFRAPFDALFLYCRSAGWLCACVRACTSQRSRMGDNGEIGHESRSFAGNGKSIIHSQLLQRSNQMNCSRFVWHFFLVGAHSSNENLFLFDLLYASGSWQRVVVERMASIRGIR